MGDDVEKLLQRRTDLSTFLVHLTRDDSEANEESRAEENLLSMAAAAAHRGQDRIRACPGLCPHLADSDHTQNVVCLSETPLEHLWMLCRPIDGRSAPMSHYGWVFRRDEVRRRRSNPVWYLDTTQAGGVEWLTKPFLNLMTEALRRSRVNGHFDAALMAQQHIFKITPYLETMGQGRTYRKDFHWEREWRHVGHLDFTPRDIVAVLAPEPRHEFLAQQFAQLRPEWGSDPRPFLDPEWSLERSIAELARGGWMVRQSTPLRDCGDTLARVRRPTPGRRRQAVTARCHSSEPSVTVWTQSEMNEHAL